MEYIIFNLLNKRLIKLNLKFVNFYNLFNNFNIIFILEVCFKIFIIILIGKFVVIFFIVLMYYLYV